MPIADKVSHSLVIVKFKLMIVIQSRLGLCPESQSYKAWFCCGMPEDSSIAALRSATVSLLKTCTLQTAGYPLSDWFK